MKPIQTPERGMGMLGPVPAPLLNEIKCYVCSRYKIYVIQSFHDNTDVAGLSLRWFNVYVQTPERGMGMLGPVPAHLLNCRLS